MRQTKIISLGWGVQSWTLAAMVAKGELEPVDYVIHSDTTWEREKTYQFANVWGEWLERHGVKVVTVQSDVASSVADEWGGVFIPAFTTRDDGRPSGMLHRQCTERWKIRPIRQWLRDRGHKCVEQWLGITVDEIQRARDSDVKWLTHRYPFLDMRMTRRDCIIWLQSHNLPVPPKSACVFCPYHTRRTWIDLKQTNGADWATAKVLDEAIRNKRPGYVSFCHPDRVPLDELKTANDFGAEQLSFVNLRDARCDSGYCFL